MMNTTTTIDKATNNQNAFNYAVYMMLGSYFKQMEAVSECYVQKLYLYYVENKRERQYSFEDIAIRFVERVLQKQLPGDLAGAGAGIVLCEGRQELCCLPGSPLHIGCAKRLPWSTHEAAVSAV